MTKLISLSIIVPEEMENLSDLISYLGSTVAHAGLSGAQSASLSIFPYEGDDDEPEHLAQPLATTVPVFTGPMDPDSDSRL